MYLVVNKCSIALLTNLIIMRDLITKYFIGGITSEEKQRLFAGLKEDEELMREFASMQNLNGFSAWLPADMDEIEAKEKLQELKREQRKKVIRLACKQAAGYAAAFVVAVTSTWAVMRPSEKTEKTARVYMEEFSTPPGQRARVKLHDGTVVWLNARTTLRYPNQFDTEERKVELDGEAFFEVKHDNDIPFVVSTEKADVKVLGTKFNVFAYDGRDEFSTSLVEGSVKVYKENQENEAILIRPNESVELISDNLMKTQFDNTDFLLWKDGVYAFDDVTFQDIVKKLELYYDVTIIVKNNNLSQFRFSGKFRQRDGVESVLRTLQKVYNFSYTKEEELNRITIR